MATTAEGVFRIIDRASRPLRQMETQALRTDIAFAKLGATMDAVGGRQTVRNIEDTDRALRGLSRREHDVTQETDRMHTSLRKTNKEMDGFWSRIRKIGVSIAALKQIIGILKFPAIAAGIGVIVTAIGQLAGGIVALLPRLSDLAGIIAPLPALLTSMGFAMATVKLAFSGLSKAMGGNKDALAALTPEARKFLEVLKGFKPVVTGLREAAQSGIFGGLTEGLSNLQRGVPTIERLLRVYSQTLGGIAASGSRRLTTPAFLRQFEALGRSGAPILQRLGRSLFNLIEAFVSFGVAARPFTRWITQTIEGWTKWALATERARDQSGKTAAFLNRTRVALTSFGHILRDLWFTMRNVGRSARFLGDDLWDSAERAVKGWRRWTSETQNRFRLIQDFDRMREGIHEMVGLVGDLGKAIYRMGTQPGLAGMAHSLRELVPILEHILSVMAQTFGPILVDTLLQFGKVLDNIAGVNGPLTVFFKTLNGIMRVFNWLLEHIPGLGAIISSALSVWAIWKVLAPVRALAAAWAQVGASAGAAAAAQTGAVAAAAGAAPAAAAVRGGGFFGMLGRGGAAAAPAGRWVAGPGGAMTWEAAATGTAATTAVATKAGMGARLAGMGGKAGLLARGAGKAAWPIAALLAGIDMATARREGSVGMQAAQTVSAGLSGASFGLIPRIKTGTEQMSERERRAVEGYTTHEGDRSMRPGWANRIRASVMGASATRHPGIAAGLERGLGHFGGAEGPRSLRDVRQRLHVLRAYQAQTAHFTSVEGKAYNQQLLDQIRYHQQLNRQMTRAVHEQHRLNRARADARQIKTVDTGLGRMAKRFNVEAGQFGVEEAMTRAGGRTTKMMGMLDPAARKVLAENVLKWAAEAKRQNPRLADEYEDLNKKITKKFRRMGDDVKIVNDKVLTGSKAQWKSIRISLVRESQLAKVGLAQNFAEIQALAVGSLTAMGYSKGDASKIVGGVVQTGLAPKLPKQPPGPPGVQGPVGYNPVSPGAAGPDGVNVRTRMYAGGPAATRQAGGGGGSQVVQVGRQLQQMGFLVGENPAFGGVAPVHVPNSYHYKGQAIDVNWPNAEQEGGKLDSIFGWLKSLNPTELLWRVKGHFDHLHVAFGGPGAGSYVPGPGGGMPGLQMPALHGPTSPLGGIPGALQTAGSKAYAAGMTGAVNQSLQFGGWMGRGGMVTAHRPTLIGIGDGGTETATVTHGGGGGGMTLHVPVTIGHIVNHREGDIEAMVTREVGRAVSKVAQHVRHATNESSVA